MSNQGSRFKALPEAIWSWDLTPAVLSDCQSSTLYISILWSLGQTVESTESQEKECGLDSCSPQ